MLISGRQMKLVVPTLTVPRAAMLAENCNFICPTYGINTQDIFHEFLANIAHESGGFRLKDENMNYKTAKRIVDVWPSRFSLEIPLPKGKLDPRLYVKNPRALANLTYGGRMGNILPDDGYNMRGGGYMGLTGRYTYTKYQEYTKYDTVENIANAVRTDEYYAMDSAAWVFAVELKLIQLAKDDQFLKIVKKINGGTIGLHDREYYYERAKKYVV
jgi:putative chitinase